MIKLRFHSQREETHSKAVPIVRKTSVEITDEDARFPELWGEAVQNITDLDNRIEGRRYAIKNALKEHDEITKVMRQEIWTSFFTHCRKARKKYTDVTVTPQGGNAT
jgi:hypothetical protein